jgi:hypothetical protein
LVLEGSTEDVVEKMPFFLQCFTVGIIGGMGRFVPIIMKHTEGMLQMCLVFFHVSILQ